MTVVHTFYVITNTRKHAGDFRLALALEKGYTSEITKVPGGHRVTASDGQAVDFLKA